MAALTAALMSTVDTLINATAAIYINDVHRPIKNFLKTTFIDEKTTDKEELAAARYSSVAITILGVLSVMAFDNFPTVYEAHGFFHSTLTPPLVVAIFLGLFWRRFTSAAVITSFVGGVALMILGLYNPVVISPFDHGIEMNAHHPYSYIRALYNTLACFGVALAATYSTNWQRKIVIKIRSKTNAQQIAYSLTVISVVLFLAVIFNTGNIPLQFIAVFIMIVFVSIVSTHFIKYDDSEKTEGLTIWSLAKAKEMFKGSKVNDREGKIIRVKWEEKQYDDDVVHFSRNDMEKMQADIGDLVYLCDARKYLGGLKSIHSTFGEPHEIDGKVYINNEQLLNGVFAKGRTLTAEKEM
ncbi:MAG: hypothetical protein KKB12_02910 [Candidatus Omnitrophica bacterium]|nr:hypothetical protein [Candidatus Omnitrophota bacterium]